jgi:hydrogenase maturation factor
MVTLNMPPKMTDVLLKGYWESVHRTCKKLGVAIIGGHTGRFQGIDYTIIGSGTMLAIGSNNHYVTSEMAKHGDDLIMTKTAALEATAVLSSVFPKTVSKHLGRTIANDAKRLLAKVGTVEDSSLAASVGLRKYVTAMHDVTEGGILSAVMDLANASHLKATLELESVSVAEEVHAVCKFFKIDPYTSLGQGSVLIASRPDATRRVIGILESHQIIASVIGSLSSGGHHHHLVMKNGRTVPLNRSKADPYWKAYWKAMSRRLK